MNLLKTLNSINEDLLIAKLYVYGFSKESLKPVKTQLTNGWQRLKLDTGFSKWTKILSGVL